MLGRNIIGNSTRIEILEVGKVLTFSLTFAFRSLALKLLFALLALGDFATSFIGLK